MLRLVPLVLCLAASTAAADGFYFSEGVGGTRVKGDLAESMPSALRIRVSVGYRAHRWGLEGYIGTDLGALAEEGQPTTGYAARTITPPTRPPSEAGSELTMYGVDFKRYVTLAPHVELYAGAGLSRGFTYTGLAGNGAGVRAGAQIKGKVPVIGFLCWPLFLTNWGPKVTAAVFIDQGVDFYRLHDQRGTSVDAQLSHVTVGFGVGSDF